MNRRQFLASTAATVALPSAPAQTRTPVRLGIDLFSIRSSGWTPIEYLDYCSKLGAKVVHFSEVRFVGSLEPENLKRVRIHSDKLGIQCELGMRSICPTSAMFDAMEGTAEAQLTRMIASAVLLGSPIVRCVLGSMEDRRPPGIEARIEDTVKVLRAMRSRAMDANIKIAIENHAGDMQGRELKTLIEESGKDFVGACLDSGNPLWTLEDPHLTLETLHPYVLTSHVRDTALWSTPEGAMVRWVRMGDGNVGIDDYVRKYTELCPGRALSLEIIVMQRPLAYKSPEFWDRYRNVPAWSFERFNKLVEAGKVLPDLPKLPKEMAAQREREDLEASIAYTKRLIHA